MIRRFSLIAVAIAIALAAPACSDSKPSAQRSKKVESDIWKPDLQIQVDAPACAALRKVARDPVALGDSVEGEDWADVQAGIIAANDHHGDYSDAMTEAGTRTLITTIRRVRNYTALSSSIAERATDTDEYIEDLRIHPDSAAAVQAQLSLDTWTTENCGFSILDGLDS